jgi:hypothetical protein
MKRVQLNYYNEQHRSQALQLFSLVEKNPWMELVT